MKIPAFLLAPAVLVSFLGVVLSANVWELPTQESRLAEASAKTSEIQIIVDGLSCRGKSNFFLSMLSQSSGVLGAKTYVQEQRAVIVYDPSKVSVTEIQQIIQTQFRLDDGRIVQPFKVREIRQ